ncbi:MAG: type II secretion system protein [bacterium]
MFRLAHKGFTLTEMMIVFTVIAILTLLSATALQSANKDNIVEEATQQILNGIRETQNRAVGVSTGTGAETIRSWAMEIKSDGTGYVIYKYIEGRTGGGQDYLAKIEMSNFTFSNNINVTAFIGNNAGTNILPVFVAYNIPFGRAFLSPADSCTCDLSCQAGTGTNASCNWKESDRYEMDWEIVAGTKTDLIDMNNNKTSELNILVSYKSNPSINKKITISASGDANAK